MSENHFKLDTMLDDCHYCGPGQVIVIYIISYSPRSMQHHKQSALHVNQSIIATKAWLKDCLSMTFIKLYSHSPSSCEAPVDTSVTLCRFSQNNNIM